jgi:hypothetical protein
MEPHSSKSGCPLNFTWDQIDPRTFQSRQAVILADITKDEKALLSNAGKSIRDETTAGFVHKFFDNEGIDRNRRTMPRDVPPGEEKFENTYAVSYYIGRENHLVVDVVVMDILKSRYDVKMADEDNKEIAEAPRQKIGVKQALVCKY